MIAPIVPSPSKAASRNVTTVIIIDATKNPTPAKNPNLNGELTTTV